MGKQLYRSTENKIIGGVCGGLGEYFEIDPSLVRVIMILLFFAHGIGLLAYLIAWIIIPQRPHDIEPVKVEYEYSSWHKYLPGIILIVIGIVLLIRETWFWFDFKQFWPLILVAVGLFLIFRKRNNNADDDNTFTTNQQPQHNVPPENGGYTQ